ncbi:MAG: wax ester/triacylglycerol synthase family O-acyltransferase [Caldilineaceae bacterium]|nr:wax ester/triacylglycerol synthase family O-acyltransferase [Caldilineaceae bacterium]
MARREVMSSVDRSWLLVDGPTNRMVINGLWIFDEPLDYPRLVRTLAERMLSFRRFRQRVVEPTGSLGRAYWEDDPHFDLRGHVRRIALPAPGNRAVLEELISSMVSDPLDTSKPLWEFYLIENYNGGSAILGRIHHCIADGVALVSVMLSLTDPTPEDSWQAPPAKERKGGWNPLRPLLRSAAKTINSAVGMGEALLSEGMETLSNPSHLLDLAGQGTWLAGKTAGVLGKLALMTSDDRTVFKGNLSVTKHVAWSEVIALDDVKLVKNRTGTTVNDVLVAVLTGALRRYMLSRGDDPTGKEIRAMVPVNIRPITDKIELGNQWALIYLTLPVGIEDPLDRLFEVKRRMDAIKRSPEALITYQIIAGLGLVPNEIANKIKEYFASKASAVLTNVPGPQQKLYFGGSLIDKMVFWVPQSGSIGLGLSILSYGGEVTVGVIADDHLVPDPQGIVEGYRAEFDLLHQLALLPDTEEIRPPSPPEGTIPLAKTILSEEKVILSDNGVEAEPDLRDPESVSEALLAEFLTLKAEADRPSEETDPEPRRCHAQTRAGERCQLRSQPNSYYCHLHQGRVAVIHHDEAQNENRD